MRYIFRQNPSRVEELKQSRHSKLQAILQYANEKNRYLKDHPRAKIATAVNAVTEKAKKLKISSWIKIEAKEREIEVKLDEEKQSEETRLDGCYVLKTDRKKEDLSKEKVHQCYKNLTEVEFAFRTMKTTLLDMRGIFVRRADRTKAHVFIVMLSYMLAYKLRRLWKEIEVTIEEGLAELSSIHTIEIHTAQVAYQKIPKPRPMAMLLLEKAGVALPDAIPCKGISVVTRKKIVSERK